MRLYRYDTEARLDPANSLHGERMNCQIVLQIPADSIIEATHKAVAIGKQLGLLLIGPTGE